MKWGKPVAWQHKLLRERIHFLGNQATAVLVFSDETVGTVINKQSGPRVLGAIRIDLLNPQKDKELNEELKVYICKNKELYFKYFNLSDGTLRNDRHKEWDTLKTKLREAGAKGRPPNHLYDLTPEECLHRDQIALQFMKHPEITSTIIEGKRKKGRVPWEGYREGRLDPHILNDEIQIFCAQPGYDIRAIDDYYKAKSKEKQSAGVALKLSYTIKLAAGDLPYHLLKRPRRNMYSLVTEELLHTLDVHFEEFNSPEIRHGDGYKEINEALALVKNSKAKINEWKVVFNKWLDPGKYGQLSGIEREKISSAVAAFDELYKDIPRYEQAKVKLGSAEKSAQSFLRTTINALDNALNLDEHYTDQGAKTIRREIFAKTYTVIAGMTELTGGRADRVEKLVNALLPPEKEQGFGPNENFYNPTALCYHVKNTMKELYEKRYTPEERARAEQYKKFLEESIERRMQRFSKDKDATAARH